MTEITLWRDKNACVLDCADTWRQLDAAGWLFVQKLHQAKQQYGDAILEDIAEQAHRKVKTLRNLVSLWNSPVRELAQDLELSTSHVNLVTRFDEEQAADYLQMAAEKALTPTELRHVIEQQSASVYPADRNDEPPFAQRDSVLYQEQPERFYRDSEIVISSTMTAQQIISQLRQLPPKTLDEIRTIFLEIPY